MVISSQHAENVDLEKQLAPEIKKYVIDPSMTISKLLDQTSKISGSKTSIS